MARRRASTPAERRSGGAAADDVGAFRTGREALSLKLYALGAVGHDAAASSLAAFAQASAMGDMIAASLRADTGLLAASRAFVLEAPPPLANLAEHRTFLDAAGLTLPRWPRVRRISAAEKHRRLGARLKHHAEPSAVRQAKSLVHRYELTLRDIVNDAMAEAYGEDWALERLPRCGCKDLLSRWRSRGGSVLDHADYHHYAAIMSDPEHFAAVFKSGFGDPGGLRALLGEAGRLRAASHHAHPFSAEDLRDLRVTWRTLAIGLVALTPDHELDICDGSDGRLP